MLLVAPPRAPASALASHCRELVASGLGGWHLVTNWTEAAIQVVDSCGGEEDSGGEGRMLLPPLTLGELREMGWEWRGAEMMEDQLLEGEGAVVDLGHSEWARGRQEVSKLEPAHVSGHWQQGLLEGWAKVTYRDGAQEKVRVGRGVRRGLGVGTSIRRYEGGEGVEPRWRWWHHGTVTIDFPGWYLLLLAPSVARSGAMHVFMVRDSGYHSIPRLAWACDGGGVLVPAFTEEHLGPPRNLSLLPLPSYISKGDLQKYEMTKLVNMVEQEARSRRWSGGISQEWLESRRDLRRTPKPWSYTVSSILTTLVEEMDY